MTTHDFATLSLLGDSDLTVADGEDRAEVSRRHVLLKLRDARPTLSPSIDADCPYFRRMAATR